MVLLLKSFLFLFWLILSLSPDLAHSHRVNLFVVREGERVYGEAFFADGKPCRNCSIEVFLLKESKEGPHLASGKTNEEGKFELKVKEKGALFIKLIAGEGHSAVEKLSALTDEPTNEAHKKQPLPQEFKTKKTKPGQAMAPSIDQEALKQMLRGTISQELSPLRESLRTSYFDLKKELNRLWLRDILSGLSYIFGILGVIAWFKAKKKV